MTGNCSVMPRFLPYSFLIYFLLLKLVTYCYAVDEYTSGKTSTLFSFGETKLVTSTYMPKLPQIISTASVFPLGRSTTSYPKSPPYLSAQTSMQTYHVDNSSGKNPYQKHPGLQFHSPTVHSEVPSPVSWLYISAPYEIEIAPSRPTIYQYSKSSYTKNFIERASSHIYLKQFSSDDIKHSSVVKKISTSLKPTPDPLTFHLSSVNLNGFYDIFGNFNWAVLKSLCELPGNFVRTIRDKCKMRTSETRNMLPFLSGSLPMIVTDGGDFVNRQCEPTDNIFKKIQTHRMRFSQSSIKETCAFVCSIFRCSTLFSPDFQDEYSRLCAFITKMCYLDPIHLNSSCSNFPCKNYLNSTSAKKEKTYSDSELPENKLITSSTTNKYIMEFQTAFVRSNPYLITNVKPKQSAHCRLCETTIFTGSDVELDHLAIAVTPANMKFPEPRTRGGLRSSATCSKFANSLQCQGKPTETLGRDLFTDDSFIPTTSPPDMVPMPCTKTVSLSTETPYLLSYEVMIDRTLYFSSTWSKQQISKSLTPTLFPEPKTVISYNVHDLSPDYGTEKQVILESSFKSFPDIMVTGTEMQSVIPIELT